MSHFIERETAENDLLACAAFVAERINSAEGHATSVADVALRYAAKGELDLAAGLADTIYDPHARDTVLAEIAARCVDFNDDDYGLQLIEAIEEFNLQQQALHQLAARQALHGKFEDALATAARTADPGMILAEIAVRAAQNDDEARAHELLDQIDFPNLRIQVLNEIALSKIKRGELPDDVLNQSLAETQNLEFPEEKTQLLLEIAARFLDARKSESGLKVLAKTKQFAETLELPFRNTVAPQIAALYARANDFAAAENALAAVNGLQKSAEAYVSFAREHFENGEIEPAISSLEEALAILKSQSERQIRNSRARFNLLATIAVRFAQFNKLERALEIALTNPDDDLRNSALRSISAVCVANGKDELALQAVEEIKDKAGRTFAFIAMSDAAAKKNNAEKSGQYLLAAENLSEEIEQLALRSEALNEIATRYAHLDRAAKSNEIMRESLQIASQILDQSQQAIVLTNVAEAADKINFQLGEVERETLRLIVRKRLM